MQRSLEDIEFWIENKTYPPDEIAARFHHRLVQIHLFPNGNGRHARLLTDYLVEEKFDKEPFSWGSGNLINEGDVRSEYIRTLQAADQQNYHPLLDFIRS